MTRKKDDFVEYLLENLQGLGPVSARAMFGGYGFFRDGLMFALVAYQTLYFKVDVYNSEDYEELDLPYFKYQKGDKLTQMSYRQAPEHALEDADELVLWALKSYQAAQRAKR